MISVFVLDVEEFMPLVVFARNLANTQVSGPFNGYFRIDASNELTFSRQELGLKPAVWHGALTGGLVGGVSHFDNNTLTLVEAGA